MPRICCCPSGPTIKNPAVLFISRGVSGVEEEDANIVIAVMAVIIPKISVLLFTIESTENS